MKNPALASGANPPARAARCPLLVSCQPGHTNQWPRAVLASSLVGNVVRLDERPRRERFPSAFGLAPPLEACAVIAAGAAIVLTALVTTPTAYGDSAEYFLMTESLANHLTPDARPEDLNSLAEMARRNTLRGGYGRVMAPYLMTDDARWYSIHFWAYPLACLPAKVLLRVTCLNEMKVPQVTNALL